MSEKKYIVSLDQGTTSSRCIIFDHDGQIVATAQREFTQIYPKPGWVEHNPMEIYASQIGVLNDAVIQNGIDPEKIAGIGIANQRETTILWDKHTGKPIYNAIVWQCRRSADIVEELKAAGLETYIRHTTGLIPDAYFSATKIKWILDNVPGAREKAEAGDILFGTVDTWLVWKLTGGKIHVTDYTNASRTMLYDIRNLVWDDKLLEALDIPKNILPTVCNSSEVYGMMKMNGVEIPIAGIAGDQQAALFGQTCFAPGEAKNTYGTGCFLLMNTGEQPFESQHGLITTIASGIDGKVTYAVEGSIFVAGAVIQWLRDELKMLNSSAESESIALSVPDNGGVYIVPAFAGLGTPHWDMYARGTICGLTRGTGRAHIVRAALESIAYQTWEVVRTMEEDTGMKLSTIKVDGGACVNDFLMQFQADILNAAQKRPVCRETTAMGVAFLAGLAVGFWNDLEEVKHLWKQERFFWSQISEEKRASLLAGWQKAIERSKGWCE
ncbi:MAG: glycerol kinase GlpK [Clostridia bacterium]|nr:glycerol kinase GlpK [Clostridia bacterium]